MKGSYDEPTLEIRDQGQHGGSLQKTLSREDHQKAWKVETPDPYKVKQVAYFENSEFALLNDFYASNEPRAPHYQSVKPFTALKRDGYLALDFWRKDDFKNGRFLTLKSYVTPAPSSHYIQAFHESGSFYLTLIQLSDEFWLESASKHAEIQVQRFNMNSASLARNDSIEAQCRIFIQAL